MEYIEIVLKDVKKSYLKAIMEAFIDFSQADIMSSHFFDKVNNKDMEYQDIKSIEEYFQSSGTCNIYFKRILFGAELEDALLLIACDEELSDLTIHFSECQFDNCDLRELNIKLKKIFSRILEIQEKCEVPNVVVGYEPAEDEDTRIFEIIGNNIRAYNEDFFNSQIALNFYAIIKGEQRLCGKEILM